MTCKIISFSIPENKNIPEEILCFSPEENFQMIKIGAECLLEGRKVVAGLTQKEIYEKIKEESKEEIQKIELEVRIEKEMSKKLEERITKIYESQIEQLKKQLDTSNKQLTVYESENKEIIFKEVNKYREKFDLLLLEKDKQNNLNREVFDKATSLLNKNKYKSSKGKGDEGEEQFSYLSETFKDFNGYRSEDKSKQGHKGDFHLFFDEFNVLVDLKNYSDSVQKKEVDKIEMDLMTNDNMDYAWLISLESDISGWNRFHIMNKWIMTDNGMKCIIFINNLLDSKEPKNTLRLVWSICNEFNKLITGADKDEEELKMYKERNFVMNKKIKNLQERVSEMRRNINISLNIAKNMDSDLIEALSLISNEIMMEECEKYQKMKEWFADNVEFCNDEEAVLKSTDVWNRFKKENKDYIAERNITIDSFKELLMKIVDSSHYIEKSKKGAIELIGFKMKEPEPESISKKEPKSESISKKGQIIKEVDFFSQEEETECNLIIDFAKEEVINEIVVKHEYNESKQKQSNKIIKSGSRWSENEDNELKKNYIDKKYDVVKISEIHNRNPGGIMLRLKKLNIIENLEETRGYNLLDEKHKIK